MPTRAERDAQIMVQGIMDSCADTGRDVRILLQMLRSHHVGMLGDFTPELEVYSIDEAFLGLSGITDPASHARTLRETVGRKTGIPVCVGISTTKTLAKVANRTAEKDPASGGVCYLADEAAQPAALARLALDDVCGIGHLLQHHLAAMG